MNDDQNDSVDSETPATSEETLAAPADDSNAEPTADGAESGAEATSPLEEV